MRPPSPPAANQFETSKRDELGQSTKCEWSARAARRSERDFESHLTVNARLNQNNLLWRKCIAWYHTCLHTHSHLPRTLQTSFQNQASLIFVQNLLHPFQMGIVIFRIFTLKSFYHSFYTRIPSPPPPPLAHVTRLIHKIESFPPSSSGIANAVTPAGRRA